MNNVKAYKFINKKQRIKRKRTKERELKGKMNEHGKKKVK